MIDEDAWFYPDVILVFKVEEAGSSGWIQPFFYKIWLRMFLL